VIVRSAFVSVTKSWPPALILAIQTLVSCGVSVGLARLALLVGHLSAFELAAIYVPGTGIYLSVMKEAEVKWPSFAWLFMLLPTALPDE
jgi:hypothetical protein